jgi:hypothetical protein
MVLLPLHTNQAQAINKLPQIFLFVTIDSKNASTGWQGLPLHQ